MAADLQVLTQALPRPLTDILKAPFKHRPIQFAKSSQTTDIFASNMQDKRTALTLMKPKLTHIIPYHTLVRQLTPKFVEALEGIWTQPGDRLSIRVDPIFTMVQLPRAIHSEKDSEDVFLALYLNPALSLVGFLKAKAKLEREDPSRRFTNEEIMDYKELVEGEIDFRLYAASFGGATHIPDIGVYELDSDKATLHLPIEIKTPAAFPGKLLSEVSPRISTTSMRRGVDTMTENDMKKIEGWAIQFNWPEKDQNFGNQVSMKHNKVISQVWCQMVKHRKQFAILSCNAIHYCFYRRDLESGHPYISPPCYPDEGGLMDICIWTLRASGYLQGDINVPPVYDKWWGNSEKPMRPGVNADTLPHEALSLYKRRLRKAKR